MAIPKIIHYCWFGGNPLPPLAKKCIRSWKKYCPDYEIKEWNENNFDINSCPKYVLQAYEAKKWAFVTDYIRLKIIFENGGIYLDTDVEVIKTFDSLLDYTAFFGIENFNNEKPYTIATGLGFGAEKGTNIIKELSDDYNEIDFRISENEYDLTPCPIRNNHIFISHGFNSENEVQLLNNNIAVLSTEFFCPITYSNNKKHITKNTYSIHHYAASWFSKEAKAKHKANQKKIRKAQKKHFIKTLPNRIIKAVIGSKNYDKLKKRLK